MNEDTSQTAVEEVDPRADEYVEQPSGPVPGAILLTPENIDEALRALLQQAQITSVTQALQQTTQVLANAMMLLRLAPFGGTPHHEQIRKEIEKAQAHLRELREMRVQLFEGPLPEPSALEVVTAPLVVPNEHDRKRR